MAATVELEAQRNSLFMECSPWVGCQPLHLAKSSLPSCAQTFVSKRAFGRWSVEERADETLVVLFRLSARDQTRPCPFGPAGLAWEMGLVDIRYRPFEVKALDDSGRVRWIFPVDSAPELLRFTLVDDNAQAYKCPS